MTRPVVGLSLCWNCLRKLYTKPGGGYSYTLVLGRDGHEHRMHKFCAEQEIASGEVKPVKVKA